jgi:hypothetical protein
VTEPEPPEVNASPHWKILKFRVSEMVFPAPWGRFNMLKSGYF